MPTSGTYSFTVTRDQIITSALQSLQIIGEGDSPSSYDLSLCSFALNLMLKKWATDVVPLWVIQTINFNLVAGTATYTLGPTGTVPLSYRPLKILEAWTRDTNNIDTPLMELARADYDLLGNKTSQSTTPVNFLFVPTISNSLATSNSTITFYPVPSDATRSAYFNVQRPLQDLNSGADEFDFPAEWFHAIKWNLAAEVALDYRANENVVAYIERRAKATLESCIGFNQEETSTIFQPNMQMIGGGYGRS